MSLANGIPDESWRPIPGFLLYEASNLGRVRSLVRKKVKCLSAKLNPMTRYLEVSIKSNRGDRKTVGVHHMVASAFYGPIPDGVLVNHKDACRTNNEVTNLELVGRAINAAHRDMFEWVRLAIRAEFQELLTALSLRSGESPHLSGTEASPCPSRNCPRLHDNHPI